MSVLIKPENKHLQIRIYRLHINQPVSDAVVSLLNTSLIYNGIHSIKLHQQITRPLLWKTPKFFYHVGTPIFLRRHCNRMYVMLKCYWTHWTSCCVFSAGLQWVAPRQRSGKMAGFTTVGLLKPHFAQSAVVAGAARSLCWTRVWPAFLCRLSLLLALWRTP